MNESEDLTIKKVQELMKNGFQLIGKEIHLGKIGEKIVLNFARGNDEKTLEFKNYSVEFMRYISHIVFIHDEKYNLKTVFMDPNKYWGRTAFPTKWEGAKICISGYVFTDFEINFFKDKIKKGRGYISRLSFDMSLKSSEENRDFLFIDYREPLEFYLNEELKFTGYITVLSYSKSLSFVRVYCEDFSCLLDYQIINANFKLSKEHGGDLIALLCDLTELSYIEKSIDGFDPNEREFELIIQIQGLDIKDDLEIGKCLITSKLMETSFLRENAYINSNLRYARLNLFQNNFYDALNNGLKLIRGAISLINFRLKIPTYLKGYHYGNQKCEASIGNSIYCKDIKNKTEIIFQYPWIKSPNF